MEQRYIQKRDIVYKLLTKWKGILLWALIGAVIGGFLGWIFTHHVDYTTSYLKKMSLKYEKKLTDEELKEVRTLMDEEADALESYAYYLGYKYQSVVAQLDYEAVDTIYTVYALKGSADDLKTYADGVSEHLVSEDVMAAAVDSLNRSIYRSYVRQLIKISFSEDYAEMTVRVWGTDRKMCRQITEVLKAEMEKNLAEELQLTLSGTVTAELSGERFESEYSDLVLHIQTAQSESLKKAEQELRRIDQGLNEKQRNYFYAAYASKKNVSQIFSDHVDTGDFRLRYCIEGACLMALAACVWISVRFFLSKRLRSVNELSETRGLLLLGIRVRRTSRKKKLVRRMYGQHGEDTKAYVAKQVMAYIGEHDITRLLVVSTLAQNSSGCARIAKLLNEQEGLCAFTEADLPTDTDMKTCGVILLETVEKTLYEQVNNLLDMYEQEGQPVLGYIAVIF